MTNLTATKRFVLNAKEVENDASKDCLPKPILSSHNRTAILKILQRRRRMLSVSLSLLFLLTTQYHLYSISVQYDSISHTGGSIVKTPGLPYKITSDKATSQRLDQRVVIVAGPHVAVSLIQENMKLWMNSDNNSLPEWEWLVPQLVTEVESEYERHSSMGFNALMESLIDQNGGIIYDQSIHGDIAERHLIKSYKTEFLKAWIKGHNIVVGSGKMNSFINQDEGRHVLEDLIDLMPWQFDKEIYIGGSNKSLEIVVMYQARRLDHLISIWKDNRKTSETLKDWIISGNFQLEEWDSLRLVDSLINQGLSVVLIDLSGIEENNLSIANITACDIIFGDCDMNEDMKSPPFVNEAPTSKNGLINLNSEELGKMDSYLKIYECQYLHLLESKSLTLLHSKGLDRLGDYCKGSKEFLHLTTFLDLPELKYKLSCAAFGGNDCSNKKDVKLKVGLETDKK